MLTDDDRRHALASAKEMESLGLETLAFATRWAETPGDEERNMVFLGVVGVGDLVRTDAPAAFAALRATGVRPLLVSEEPLPEAAIRAGNVLRPHALILTGGQIEAMDGAALRDAARDTDAFLSMNASQRGKLLRALRAEGSVAALSTGPDGGVRLSIGRGEDAEAALRSGGLPAVAELIESIRSLRQSFAAVREGEGPPGGRA